MKSSHGNRVEPETDCKQFRPGTGERREGFDRAAYRRRAKVENSVGWLKENRGVGTRYDKLASSFLAFVNLAIIRRYLRILAPDDPSDRT